MKGVALLCLASALLFVSGIEAAFNSHHKFNLCVPHDEFHFTRCLEKFVDNFLHELRDGEITDPYFPKVETVVIPRLSVMVEEFMYKFKFDLANIKFSDVSNVDISDVIVKTDEDYDKVALNFTYNFPAIRANATFDVSGTVWGKSIDAAGIWSYDYSNAEVKFYIIANTTVVDHRRSWILESLKMDFNVKNMNMSYSVTSGTWLGKKAVHQLVKRNVRELMDKLKPGMEREFQHMATNYVEQLLQAFPYHKWIYYPIFGSAIQMKSTQDNDNEQMIVSLNHKA